MLANRRNTLVIISALVGILIIVLINNQSPAIDLHKALRILDDVRPSKLDRKEAEEPHVVEEKKSSENNEKLSKTSAENTLFIPEVKQYRFGNGRIQVGSSRYSLSRTDLEAKTPAELEALYENVVLETTADCSTTRRFGLREDGGWDLCLVGPFTPQKPCFSFSFGVNNIWGFDDEVATTFGCRVVAFDPSMSQASHARSDKVTFLKEGLHAKKSTLNSWSVDSYLGFLKRFGAENFIVDILKIDVETSEWPALQTSVRDGSLRNVKQLMIETHIGAKDSMDAYLRYFDIFQALYDLGFRQWHHNWNVFGNYKSSHNVGQERTCCHELYYINVNFLTGKLPARNSGNTFLLDPLTAQNAFATQHPQTTENLKTIQNHQAAQSITKTTSYNQVDTVLAANLKSLSDASLEEMYFGILQQQHINCPYSTRIGDTNDGGWDVCFSGAFNIHQSKPCVAFSFGINNIWGYDDALADKYHCMVYMYDPSMVAVNDHKRKETSWFYRTGLSSENKVESNGWKMRTLCSLLEEHGYADKPVDILKIDIEHWEWVSFEKALEDGCLKNVKQLLFESHTSELVGKKTDYAWLVGIWQRLFRLGFRTWKWHKNPQSTFFKSPTSGQRRACCFEHYMLNNRFDQF